MSLLTFHSGGYPSSPAGRSASPRSLAGAVLRSLDHVIAVNREIEQLFHRFGVPPARTVVIEPHGDQPSPEPSAVVPESLARFAQSHDPLFVTVGLLEPEYCLPLQIDTLPLIRERSPNAGLMIIGSGSLETELRSRIARSSVPEHILLAGDVPHTATLHLIQRARVVLRTTRFDGDSVSVREALALGTPVLASDNGMRPSGVNLLAELAPELLASRAVELATAPRPPRSPASRNTRSLKRVLALYRQLLRGEG